MVHGEARKIFGKKTDEYASLLEELEEEMAKAGIDAGDIYYGLTIVKESIKNKKDLKKIGKEIVELWKKAVEAGVRVWDIYWGLEKVRELIKNKEDLKEIGEEMIELGKEAIRAGVDVWDMYEYGLASVEKLIKNKKDLKEIGKEIVELSKEAVGAGINAGDIYYGLAIVKELIKNKEDLKEIVELGKEAIRAGVKNVGNIYYGLGKVRELIKEDLKEIVELGKEAIKAGVDVGNMYEYGLGSVKEKFDKLRKKFGKKAYEIINKAAVNGFLNSLLIDELALAYEQGKFDEKIKELKKERDKIVENKEIKNKRDVALLYSLTNYSIEFEKFEEEIEKIKNIDITGEKPFDSFDVEIKRQVVKFRPEAIEKIKKFQSEIREAYEKNSKKKEAELKKELLTLQKQYDKTRDKALEKELIDGYIALTLMKNETLKNDVLSDNVDTAVTNIYQLIHDRIEDTKNEILTDPSRLALLFEEQGIKIKKNDYGRASEFYKKKKERLLREREELRKKLKEKQETGEKYEINRLGSKIGEINKKLKLLSDYENILKFKTDELRKMATELESIEARAKKKEKATEHLVFETGKSFLDGIAGYISKDCTAGKSNYFKDYFSTDKAHNIKIYREKEGHKTWIGNIYLLHPEKNIFILDAFQLATPTQYNTEQLWKEIISKLKKSIGNSKLYISEFLSNYEQIRKGFYNAFPEKKKVNYKLKGFDAFESSSRNFFEV